MLKFSRIGFFTLIALLAVPALAQQPAAPATAQAPGAHRLADEVWEDRAYGIRVRLPVDVTAKSQTGDDYLLRAADQHGQFTLALAVKRSNSILTLAKVADSARKQILSVQGTSDILEERNAAIMGRPGVVIHARMPLTTTGEQLLSQAIVQLDGQTFAVLEGRTAFGNRTNFQPVFDAVVASMEMDDPKVLDQRRQETLTAGHEWRTRVGIKALQTALLPEQLYRLVKDGQDIGYVRMRQGRGQREGFQGFEVEVQTRIVSGADNIDSLARFFLSDDDRAEFWTITTTKRPAAAAPAGAAAGALTFVETGIRTDDEILISTDGPPGHKKNRLARPPVGYLSQVEAALLPQILPIDRPATYGFYFYNARDGRLTFRTDQVTPALTGFGLSTRLSPNDAPIRSMYTAQRVLVEKELGPGEKQLPTTAQELQRLWTGRQ
jgi:hypothetical protein